MSKSMLTGKIPAAYRTPKHQHQQNRRYRNVANPRRFLLGKLTIVCFIILLGSAESLTFCQRVTRRLGWLGCFLGLTSAVTTDTPTYTFSGDAHARQMGINEHLRIELQKAHTKDRPNVNTQAEYYTNCDSTAYDLEPMLRKHNIIDPDTAVMLTVPLLKSSNIPVSEVGNGDYHTVLVAKRPQDTDDSKYYVFQYEDQIYTGLGWVAAAVGDFPTARPLNWDADPGDDMLGDGFVQRYTRWRNENPEDLPGRHLFGAELAEAMSDLKVGLMRRKDYVRCPDCDCCEGCTAFKCVPNKLCCTDFMDKHLGGHDLYEFMDLLNINTVDIKQWTCATRCLKRSLWVFIPLSLIGGCAATEYFCCDNNPRERAIPPRSRTKNNEKAAETDIEAPDEDQPAAASPNAASPRDNDYVERGRPDGNRPYFRDPSRYCSEDEISWFGPPPNSSESEDEIYGPDGNLVRRLLSH